MSRGGLGEAHWIRSPPRNEGALACHKPVQIPSGSSDPRVPGGSPRPPRRIAKWTFFSTPDQSPKWHPKGPPGGPPGEPLGAIFRHRDRSAAPQGCLKRDFAASLVTSPFQGRFWRPTNVKNRHFWHCKKCLKHSKYCSFVDFGLFPAGLEKLLFLPPFGDPFGLYFGFISAPGGALRRAHGPQGAVLSLLVLRLFLSLFLAAF